jgi:hypothetical protein
MFLRLVPYLIPPWAADNIILDEYVQVALTGGAGLVTIACWQCTLHKLAMVVRWKAEPHFTGSCLNYDTNNQSMFPAKGLA